MTRILKRRTILDALRVIKEELAATIARDPKAAEDAAREAGAQVGSMLFVASLVLLAYLLGMLSIWWNWPI